MFGSTQGLGVMAGAAQEAPGKRTKQEEKTTVVPVTVCMLDSAVAARTDESAEVLLHGSEAGVVHLVGVVESLVQQAAMLEFTLNDASGRIKVRHYTSSPGLGQGIKGLAAGKYINIVGNLRTSPTVHVSAMSLREVTSADEISYHMIEVALATLRLRSPELGGGVSMAGLGLSAGVSSGAGTPSPTKREVTGSTPMKVDAPVPSQLFTSEKPAPAVVSTDIRTSILTVLRQEQDNGSAEGLGLSNVIAKLAHCKAPAGKVQEMLQELVTEGEVFTTIDDDHFAVL